MRVLVRRYEGAESVRQFCWHENLGWGVDRGRGGTSSSGRSAGGVLRLLLAARVGSAVRSRFLVSAMPFERVRLCVGADCGRGGITS
jgi:hypothetical protein